MGLVHWKVVGSGGEGNHIGLDGGDSMESHDHLPPSSCYSVLQNLMLGHGVHALPYSLPLSFLHAQELLD